MATLSATELTSIRQKLAKYCIANDLAIDFPKGAVNDAAQTVENFLGSSSSALTTTINTASQAYGKTFTAEQQTLLIALVLFAKYVRDS